MSAFSSPKALPLLSGKVALVRETSPAGSGPLLYSVVVFLDCALKDTVGYPLLHYISLPQICLSLSSLILHQFPLNILFIHTNIPNPLPILYSSIPFYRTVNWFIRSLFCEHTLCMLVLIKKEVIVRAAITNLDLTWPAFTN